MIGMMILNSVFNILTPALSACWGSYGIIFCRVMQGLGQGFLYPCIMNMMSKWTPINERSRVSSFVYNGATVGIITSMPITGTLCSSRWGWPASFYLYGILGILWICIFAVFAADSPHTFKCISESEIKYIEANTSHTSKVKKHTKISPKYMHLKICILTTKKKLKYVKDIYIIQQYCSPGLLFIIFTSLQKLGVLKTCIVGMMVTSYFLNK